MESTIERLNTVLFALEESGVVVLLDLDGRNRAEAAEDLFHRYGPNCPIIWTFRGDQMAVERSEDGTFCYRNWPGVPASSITFLHSGDAGSLLTRLASDAGLRVSDYRADCAVRVFFGDADTVIDQVFDGIWCFTCAQETPHLVVADGAPIIVGAYIAKCVGCADRVAVDKALLA
jgi:hypothetical protein